MHHHKSQVIFPGAAVAAAFKILIYKKKLGSSYLASKLHEKRRILDRGGGVTHPKFYYVDSPLVLENVDLLFLIFLIAISQQSDTPSQSPASWEGRGGGL